MQGGAAASALRAFSTNTSLIVVANNGVEVWVWVVLPTP
jgi:hypothetical protein